MIIDETVHRRNSHAVRWMTRLIVAKKGVASYDIPRVGACSH
jgi:hypothetical protein